MEVLQVVSHNQYCRGWAVKASENYVYKQICLRKLEYNGVNRFSLSNNKTLLKIKLLSC